MLKKINKQREKIEKLAVKENDVAEKLEQLRQELAGEREALDEMEKEHLFGLMRERSLSLEETIALMEQGAEELTDDIEGGEPDDEGSEDARSLAEPEEPAEEMKADYEDVFTEDLIASFTEKQEEDISDKEAADHGGFWKR